MRPGRPATSIKLRALVGTFETECPIPKPLECGQPSSPDHYSVLVADAFHRSSA